MRFAFKEWAIVVDALGRGDQILIFRKGGLHEGRDGFRLEHPRFWLFPTLYHQQREQVVPAAQVRFDRIAPAFAPRDRLRLEFFAEVAEWRRLDSLALAGRFRGQHIWRDQVIARRFDWARERSILVLAVKVYELPEPVELLMASSYSGCKSWVELETEISTTDARPVLAEAAFVARLDNFRSALTRCERTTDTLLGCLPN